MPHKPDLYLIWLRELVVDSNFVFIVMMITDTIILKKLSSVKMPSKF